MRRSKLVLVSVLVLLSLLTAQCTPAAPAEESAEGKVWKLAAIFPGVITDADYNTLAYEGIVGLQQATGIETAYSESVAVPDVDRVMREYIDAGFNIIWTHGGQYVTQTAELAVTFPEVVFIAEGDAPLESSPANLWFIDRNFHVGYYGIGAVAGIWNAFQQQKLAREQMKFQKGAFTKQLGDQRQSYNTALEDRVRARHAFEEKGSGATDSYLSKHSL